MKKKIIFTTGGTGGHIIPAINLMKHYSEIGAQVLLVTDERGKNFTKEYPYFKSYVLNAGTTTNKNRIYLGALEVIWKTLFGWKNLNISN